MEAQVNKQMYVFKVFCPNKSFVTKGPAKTIPVYLKGTQFSTFSYGRLGVRLILKGSPSSFTKSTLSNNRLDKFYSSENLIFLLETV